MELNSRIEQFLTDMFDNRLSSMMHLRIKMEEIANAHKQEESQYVDTIKDILKQSIAERDKQTERESTLMHKLSEFETKYRSEVQEKMKAKQLFTSFKEEGSTIMQRMKHSLASLTDKCRREKATNQILSSRIAQLESELAKKYIPIPISDNNHMQLLENDLKIAKKEILLYKEAQAEPSANDTDIVAQLKGRLRMERENMQRVEQALENKCNDYRHLIEEEELVIQSLEARVKTLEQENDRLKSMHQIPSDDDSAISEYMELYSEMKNFMDPEESTMHSFASATNSNPRAKMQAQNKLIKMLLARLKSEEKLRKVAEEKANEAPLITHEKLGILVEKCKELEHLADQQRQEALRDKERIKKLLQEDKAS